MSTLRAIHGRLLPDIPGIGWTPYLWLVYLGFFFIRYFYVTPTLGEGIAVVGTLAAFLVLYFAGYWRRGWAQLPIVAGIALLGTAWAPSNQGAGVFFIYACSFAAWAGPPARAASLIAFVLLWAAAVAVFWQPHPTFWMPALMFGAIIGAVNIHYAGQTRKDAALRMSQDEVRQLARVAERERISRDLHDLLGHTLSLITLKAELAKRLIAGDPERATAEIAEVERVSRAALADVREAVSGVRARGFAGELEHAALALKAGGVALEVDGDLPPVRPEREAVLAMVMREAVTNVIRHAHAQTCRIVVRAENGEVLLEVRDDGRGGRWQPGGGIDGMRARLAAAGGRLEIADEYGTRVRAWLPL